MPNLIWHAPMHYGSQGDEAAFFTWLQSIPGVVSVKGYGHELHIGLRSAKLSTPALREFIALYERYGGRMQELAQFANASNESWFTAKGAPWHASVFGSGGCA
jgi:hypothetical protein